MTILRASKGLDPKAFKELYVYAYDLVKTAKRSRKTLILGVPCQKIEVPVEENIRILTEHSEALSRNGWAVLDLASFHPYAEKLLAEQKKWVDRDVYLYNFLLPLITDELFTAIHLCKNCFEAHNTTFASKKATRQGLFTIDLE